jgi:hypothetical protein
MSTIAVRRTFAVLLATLLAVVACYTVLARGAGAAVRPASQTTRITTPETPRGPHRAVISDAVKYVRNADGTVTRTR